MKDFDSCISGDLELVGSTVEQFASTMGSNHGFDE